MTTTISTAFSSTSLPATSPKLIGAIKSTQSVSSSPTVSAGATSHLLLLTALLVENSTNPESTKEPYMRPFTETAIVASAVILLTFLVLGLFGNIITIYVISINPQLKNIFMFFIFSLCVSDLWSAMISWLCLYRRTWGFDVWSPLPAVFCRFYWASDLLTSYVTSMHIFSFALLRYIAVQFPIAFGKIKLFHAKIWIGSIWIFCFLFGFVPFFIFFDARYRDRLSDSPDARWPACTITPEWYEIYLVYQKIGYSLCLYAPTAGVVVASLLLSVTVLSRSKRLGTSKSGKKKRKKERQAVLQLVLIVFSFLIGYIPFTAYEFWSVQPRPNILYYRYFDYWFGMVQYCFLRFSECLNPLFYNLGSSKMRRYTKKCLRLKVCCCCPKEVLREDTTNSSASVATPSSKTIQQTCRSSDDDLDS